MKISGFTFARNADKLYYPVRAAIESILPVVDEFVVALGDCDADDHTLQEIQRINSDKIRVIHTAWDLVNFPNGMEYARQTNIAKDACSGDWLFYIQCDEVVHEKYLPLIVDKCKQYLEDDEVEGFLFDFVHFWGDYNHFLTSHAWYPKEIRIIRNRKDIYSWRDAQSFRKIPDFDGKNFYQKRNTSKLRVVKLNAAVHHYGFVRPPHLMQKKSRNHRANYKGNTSASAGEELFDYGDLSRLNTYMDSQPLVLHDWISRFNWGDHLKSTSKGLQHRHNQLKYRMLTFVEQRLLGGETIFDFKNYQILKGKK